MVVFLKQFYVLFLCFSIFFRSLLNKTYIPDIFLFTCKNIYNRLQDVKWYFIKTKILKFVLILCLNDSTTQILVTFHLKECLTSGYKIELFQHEKRKEKKLRHNFSTRQFVWSVESFPILRIRLLANEEKRNQPTLILKTYSDNTLTLCPPLSLSLSLSLSLICSCILLIRNEHQTHFYEDHGNFWQIEDIFLFA